MGAKPQTNMLTVLQSEVMREADSYATMVAQACDDMAATNQTVEADMFALRWKLEQATAAYINATEDNPAVGIVDMLVLSTLSHSVLESPWVTNRFGESVIPLLEVHRKLEKTCWLVAEQVLTPTQQEDLRMLIDEWIAKNPNQRYVAALRFRDFIGLLGKKQSEVQIARSSSLFSMLSLDPLAGLDPAVRAIEQTRYLAERMAYYLQRMPTLIAWQTELLTYQIAEQPAPRQLIADANRLSKAADAFSKTAEELPKLINDQREAAINQIFAELAKERTNILNSLSSEEGKVRDLLAQTRSTLEAGAQMATSVDGAIKSLDAFVRYVSPPDTNPPPVTVDTNSHPFNVLDYGTAADHVAGMAKDLNTLLTSADQNAARVAQIGKQATDNAERLLHRAFWLGLILIVIALGGAFLLAIVYRRLTTRPPR